jgi:histidinol-phosphate/aromatic aminotransferase/cobyric acid decarboxylase-like protein
MASGDAQERERGRALAHIKPSVRAMGAYTLRADEPRIKLNQNESPFDVPEALKARIAARLADRPWNRYPPFVPPASWGRWRRRPGGRRRGCWSPTAPTS